MIIITGCVDKDSPVGMSPRIFKHTPAWNAVKAIMKDDTCKLAKELKGNPYLKNVTDPYYGYTILTTAILNNKIKSTEKLLKFGFDPNYINDSLNLERSSPVIDAVDFSSTSPKILELVLKYGGDPNSFQAFQMYNGKLITFEKHAISFAASDNLEKIKILLKYGADINPQFGITPVNIASVLNVENLLYLLEHGANPYERFPIMDYSQNPEKGDSIGYKTIADRLRSFIFPLNSKEYQTKLKVIDFLKDKGLDYNKTEIPNKTLKKIQNRYPDTWEEYIKVY